MLNKLFTTMMVMLTLFSVGAYADSKTVSSTEKEMVQLAGADYWREVREGQSGYSTSEISEHGQLINVSGEQWRKIRNDWISPIGASVIGVAAVSIFLFYLLAGRVALKAERTGKKVLRWTPFERALHWFTASLFILLALSGIVLLYGKLFLKPVTSQDVWGVLIYTAKVGHNYLGPLFVLGLLTMLIKWFKNNIFNKVDWEWFKQGGGILPNGKHPQAGFCNGGEKVWYWLLATAGIVVCISGLIMDFPIFGQLRSDMQIANIVHAVFSLGLIAAALGHIYIGTAGTEGAFEGMATGYVDETWAKQHHGLWYEDVKELPENQVENQIDSDRTNA